MKYMLDTNICIYAMKRKPNIVFKRMTENVSAGLCISAITLAELEHGINKSVNKKKNRQTLNNFLEVIEILPFDMSAATEYGKICAYLQSQGTPIGPLDMLIAAHALAESLTIVTNNVKEFERVPGLIIENWSE